MPDTEQVTVLFLEQKIYLAILALADNPPEGAEQSIEQGLESFAALAAGNCTWVFPVIAARTASALKGCPRNTSSFAGSIGKMWPVAVG